MCIDDWNIDHRKWSKICSPKDGQHKKIIRLVSSMNLEMGARSLTFASNRSCSFLKKLYGFGFYSWLFNRQWFSCLKFNEYNWNRFLYLFSITFNLLIQFADLTVVAFDIYTIIVIGLFVLSWCTSLCWTIGNIGLFHGLESDIVVT